MAFISDTAILGENITIGKNTVIEEDAEIGSGCVIGCNVNIKKGVKIGANTRIDDNAVLGKLPMKAANSATTKDQELSPLTVGANCIIGTNVVLYNGAVISKNVLIADGATVRENVSVGRYTIIGRGAAVENFCSIGNFCKIETNAYITAYSTLEDRCFIAPGVVTSNDNFVGRTEERFKHFKGVTVKKGGRVGAGAVILPGITIGEDALVGAGAVVTKDVPSKTIVVGAPAKPFRSVPEEQLLEKQGWVDKE